METKTSMLYSLTDKKEWPMHENSRRETFVSVYKIGKCWSQAVLELHGPHEVETLNKIQIMAAFTVP